MKRAPALRHLVQTTIIGATIASTALLTGPLALAETVRVPVGETTQSYSGALPARGSSKHEVEAQFGPANSAHGPSGEPPIYYWEYSDFTVYFENDYVIHTVIKKR